MLGIHMRLAAKLAPIVLAILGLATLAYVFAPTTSTTQVPGIATESAREMQGVTQTPVQYVFEGEKVEAFAPVTAIAGDQVVLYVDSAGKPVNASWVDFIFYLSAMVGVTLPFLVFFSWLSIDTWRHDVSDEKWYRGRVFQQRDWQANHLG